MSRPLACPVWPSSPVLVQRNRTEFGAVVVAMRSVMACGGDTSSKGPQFGSTAGSGHGASHGLQPGVAPPGEKAIEPKASDGRGTSRLPQSTSLARPSDGRGITRSTSGWPYHAM
jgi:hypothetical protein